MSNASVIRQLISLVKKQKKHNFPHIKLDKTQKETLSEGVI